LGDIRSIWYRNPAAFRFPDGMSDVERGHAHREARLGLGGVLATLPVLWVNNPNRAADAMYKPVQLTTATACGLAVPPTLVTNLPEAVSEFAQGAPGGLVCKTFGPNSVTEDGVPKVAYTHRLNDHDLNDLRGISTTTHQIQHWVQKAREVRVVAVAEQLFGISIDAHSAPSRVDWRADFDALTYQRMEIPPSVEKGVRRYMDTLGLTYAAFDFVIEQDTGRWLFLESNSSGQYAWLEAATGAPITKALVNLLVAGRRV
jgi:glutathione synthase/RimK-type ligase-like ATP-grasp enzyme